jgi:hypothetical protein
VSRNLDQALNVWEAWESVGRNPERIEEVLRKVAMDTHRPNVRRVLEAHAAGTDPMAVLSGPKVQSFGPNLVDDTEKVTIDTWKTHLQGGIEPERLHRNVIREGQRTKGPSGTYLAYTARDRQVAEYLTQRTGQQWHPREVQETGWAWTKGLSEMPGGGTDPAANIGRLTEERIREAGTSFADLLAEPRRRAQLGRISDIRLEAGLPGIEPPRRLPPKMTELGGMAPQRAHLEALAERMRRANLGELVIPAFGGALLGGGLLRQEEPRPGLLSPIPF